MKNYLILLALSVLFACAGGKKEKTSLEDSLAKANEIMVEEMNEKDTVIHSKEAALSAFIKSFNEIQDNLNQIKAKEKILNTNTKGTELSKSAKEQIISDIQFIYEQLHKNKQNLASVNKKLKDSNIEIEDLNTAIANLNEQNINKEEEITELKQHLEKLNVDFGTLQDMYEAQGVLLGKEIDTLNTAYYTIGTTAFLKKNGVITKEGGFIGIGKTTELNKNVDEINFTKIDITAVKEISLNGAKKVKLVTPHPTISYSYKFIKKTAYDKLVILDPKKFWKASKYLVIEIEK